MSKYGTTWYYTHVKSWSEQGHTVHEILHVLRCSSCAPRKLQVWLRGDETLVAVYDFSKYGCAGHHFREDV